MNDVLSPLAVAIVEASYGAEPLRSTKIVTDEGVPTQFFTTCTVERSCLLVMVHVRVAPFSDGDVTGNGPPLYACGPWPQSMVAV